MLLVLGVIVLIVISTKEVGWSGVFRLDSEFSKSGFPHSKMQGGWSGMNFTQKLIFTHEGKCSF